MLAGLKAGIVSGAITPQISKMAADCHGFAVDFNATIKMPNLSAYASVIDKIEFGIKMKQNWDGKIVSIYNGNYTYLNGSEDFNNVINGATITIHASAVGCSGDEDGPSPDHSTVGAGFRLTLSDGDTIVVPPSWELT